MYLQGVEFKWRTGNNTGWKEQVAGRYVALTVVPQRLIDRSLVYGGMQISTAPSIQPSIVPFAVVHR